MDGVQHVGVVGGGTMGRGIVQSLVAAGLRVTLVERDDAELGGAVARLTHGLNRAGERGLLPEPAGSLLARVTGTTSIADLAGADLVIEAVPEVPELKAQVLREVSNAVAHDVIIATNTSSLSIDELAAAVPAADRFVGMHFFNPVPSSLLVEVVRGAETSSRALSVAHGIASMLRKESIEVANSPGFATSRLGVLLGLEAVRMLAEGVGSAEDIDKAMELGYRHPMGPLRLSDLVGLDVRLGIARYLHRTLGDRFEPPQLLVDLVESGRLGRKSGRGFYEWT